MFLGHMLFGILHGVSSLFFVAIFVILFVFFALLSYRRKENRILKNVARVCATMSLAFLVLLTMRLGIQTFFRPPEDPGHFSSWKLNQKLKSAEERGDTAKVEEIRDKIEKKETASRQKREAYSQAMQSYIKIRRFIAAFIGILMIILGVFIADYLLGAGFIMGGAFCIWDATSVWWYSLSDVVRFTIIIGALLLLFVVGYVLVKRSRQQK